MHIKESVAKRESSATIPRHHFALAPFAIRLAVMYGVVDLHADHSRILTNNNFPADWSEFDFWIFL